MKTTIIGLGYIGLPLAILAAKSGLEVHGVDTSDTTIAKITNIDVEASEPKLQQMLEEASALPNFQIGTTPKPGDVFVLTVPTPVNDDRSADLSYLFQALSDVSPHLNAGNTIIIESTSPPGTTALLQRKTALLRPDLRIDETEQSDIHFAYCPERIIPGNTFKELVNNQRIIGSNTSTGRQAARDFYSSFVSAELHVSTPMRAELTKLIENAYRDVNIAFANEVAQICESLGEFGPTCIDLANNHPRVNILNPGVGVGGHCIAVDPWFLIEDYTRAPSIIATSRHINDNRPANIIEEMTTQIGPLEGRTIAVLGLTYKPDTADTRESPSYDIVGLLGKKNVKKNTRRRSKHH